MSVKNTVPLGHVELPDGSIAIRAMNNLFLNYTFENSANWEALRLVVNIFIDAYKRMNPDTTASTIDGNIEVRTQFQHLLKSDGKTTRDQDIKLTEDDNEVTFIEFQNKAKTEKPLELRAMEYFSLGISRSNGSIANQLWLLAEDVEIVLHGNKFLRYVFKGEYADITHPSSSSIMYISLTKLSQEQSPAGELASFLLGKTSIPIDGAVKKVADTFNSSFSAFKTDKEVFKMLSLQEKARSEGLYEGIEIGEARGEARGAFSGANRVVELINSGLSADEALRKFQEEQKSKLLVNA